MEHSGKKTLNLPSQIFHRLLHPEWPEIDHINRDGLDNRRKNLRDGSNSVNVQNQSKRIDNTSGKTGVHFSKSKNAWIVQWPENGKRKCKMWTVSKYGDEKAKNLATKFRIDMDKELDINNGYKSDGEEKEYPIFNESVKYERPLFSTNTSGIHGVSLNGKKTAWVASWNENGKRKNKSFNIEEHGNEQAKNLAGIKRKEMIKLKELNKIKLNKK